VLGDRLGISALRRRPGPRRIEDPGGGHFLHAGQRELDPAGRARGREHAPQPVQIGRIKPDQRVGRRIDAGGLAAATADSPACGIVRHRARSHPGRGHLQHPTGPTRHRPARLRASRIVSRPGFPQHSLTAAARAVPELPVIRRAAIGLAISRPATAKTSGSAEASALLGRLATGDWRLATGDWRLATGG
jgi:hypothetical protein